VNKSGVSNLLWTHVPEQILMKRIYVGALTGFTYLGRWVGFPQVMRCGEKYSQLKLINIQNNSMNFLVNSWYLNVNLFVSLTFIPEYKLLILMN
jgi:hypothetical protein